MAQQTAVDWLVKEFNLEEFIATVEFAKAKEKEQIVKAFDVGFNRGHDCGENQDWHEGENRGSEFYEQEYLGKKRIYPDDYPEWAKQETYGSDNQI